MTEPKHPLDKGFFVSFEGGEGVGKTTQIALLARRLKENGYPVESFREPGSTKIGEAIRSITHDKANITLDYRAEALLIAAGRAQIVNESYRPALTAKHIILADRYVDSSYVYQGMTRGLGLETVTLVNDFAIDGLFPDLTILLNLDYRIGRKRRFESGDVNRFDVLPEEFYQKLQSNYLEIAKKYPERIVVLDADTTIEQLHETIWQLIVARLKPLDEG